MNLFINQQELDNCVLEQLLNLKEFEERFVELMMRLFETESCLFLFGFKRELENHNQLIEMESLYDFLTDLEEIYLKCVEIFNKNFSKFESEQVKEIVVGIIETLKSSLEMFPRESDNMIAYERITMVSEAITQLKGMIRESIATYMSQHLSTTFSDFDMKNMIEALLNHILRDHLTQMRDLHGWSLKEINVYDHRVQGKKYMNFVSSAKKMLTAYQSIRVDIVESQIQAGAENETLKQILMIIAEIYKRLDGKEKQMFEMVNKSGFTMETIKKSFDSLMDYKPILERMEENEELLDCFNDFASKKQDIVQRLSVSITDEIKKAIMFSMQEFIEASKEFQLLSCMAVQHLKIAQQEIEEIDLVNAVLPGELKKALTALKETMSMKYLTLKEKEFDYTLSKKEGCVSAEKQLLDFGDALQTQISGHFEIMVSSTSRPFNGAHENYMRLVNQLLESNLKDDMQYLKSELLFEIMTLEEIIKFSLPKLQESKEHVVVQMIQIIQSCYENIERLLQKSGFTSIEPSPHERFNGKDHEVVLVELNPAFLKGEIIQVHSKGYKFRDMILRRANVIAAK